jgi:uncharacterized repeat protein (TIGR02543 family)
MGVPVTSIGYGALAMNPNLVNVQISLGIVSLGELAFYGCENLKSVTFPASLMDYVEGTFDECHGLEAIIVDEDNPSYSSADGVLFDKEFSKIILYPNGKPETVYEIPSTVRIIGNGAFFRCTSLTNVTIPDGALEIEDNAFYGCTGLTEIVVPFGVTSIGIRAFTQCYSAQSILIPGSVTTIGYEAFKLCIELTEIMIPASVISIGHGPFRDSTQLETIFVDPENAFYSSQDGVLYDESLTRLIAYPVGSTQTDFVVPASVTSIDGWAFLNCDAIETVTLPDGLTGIGYEAFRDCPNLGTMIIPASVSAMGANVFISSMNAELLVVSPSQPAGWDSLWNAENLPVTWGYVVWQPTLTFETDGGTAVESITQKEGSPLTAPPDPTKEGFLFAGWFTDSDLTIPYSFSTMPGTDIVVYAKWNPVVVETDFTFLLKEDQTYEVTGYTGTDTVLSIPSEYLGASVTSIGNLAFQNNPSITSVTIPSTVTHIGNRAFYNCDGIVNFEMPDTVLTMGDYLFAYSSGLTNVTLSQSLTTIRNSTFEGCPNLAHVSIPEGVTAIEAWAFQGCRSLTSFTIPAGVTRILYTAFGGCTGLTSIIIPIGVTEIQYNVFSSCSFLTIYCEATSQPEGWSSTWNPSSRPVVWGYGS